MQQQQTKIFFPNLDGIRLIAFLAVFVNHAVACLHYNNTNTYYNLFRERYLKGGDLGVNLFFVLSGFLITFLLIKEKELNGKINIPHFYLRRILRIWPVYFLVVIVCLFLLPHFEEILPANFPISVSTHKLNPWHYLTFTGNFDYLHNGISNVLIGVLWSVSVEEQFYLFWPLLIAFIPHKYLLRVFIVIVLGSIAFRFFFSLGGNAMILKYHSLSSVSDLATGAILAYLSTMEYFKNKIKSIPRWFIVLIYILFFILVYFRGFVWKFGAHYVHVAAVLPVIFSLIFAFFISEQNYADHSFYKLQRFKIFSSLGKYTYGMYCYHMIIFFLVVYVFYLAGVDVSHENKFQFIIETFAALALTILISVISYNYFEKYFLKLKDHFASIIKG